MKVTSTLVKQKPLKADFPILSYREVISKLSFLLQFCNFGSAPRPSSLAYFSQVRPRRPSSARPAPNFDCCVRFQRGGTIKLIGTTVCSPPASLWQQRIGRNCGDGARSKLQNFATKKSLEMTSEYMVYAQLFELPPQKCRHRIPF